MTDDPYIETLCETDAAPRLRAPWWMLALLVSAIGAWWLAYGLYLLAAWILGQMIDAALSIGWPT